MKRYNVTVNGVTYDVVVEEIAASGKSVSGESRSENVQNTVKTAVPSDAVAVKAPMPGTILKLNVTSGQSVKKGEVIAILEAMKMENEIPSPIDGVIASVNVSKGSSVKTDDVIVTVK